MIADLRFALRSLRRARAFALTSILTLGLGIALVTAAFSLVDGVLVQPLPFGDADRIVTLAQEDGQGAASGVSYPNFEDWQRQDAGGAFAAMGYARGRGTDLVRPDGPRRTLVAFVSPQFLSVLQPRVMLGRLFTPDEVAAGSHLAVLTYPLWRDQFGGDPAVLGRSISTSDGSFTVVGVLAGTTVYPGWASLYLPLPAIAATEHVLSGRDFHADSRAIARLRPGATIARGRTELAAIARRLAVAYPAEDGAWPSATVTALRQELFGDVPSRLVIIGAAMALVLFIAWVNLANLSLVRASSRIRELAIRASLGASRWRVARQLLVEQAVLAAVAAALGAYGAAAVLALLRGFAAAAPGSDAVAINGRALAFAAGVAVLSTVIIGVLPAAHAARADLAAPLKDAAAGTGASPRLQCVRGALVIGEIALALMLVIAAGLLVRSFWALSHVDPGFDTHGLVAIDFSPPGRRYAEPAQAAAFYTRVLTAAEAIPGVERAALTNHMPLNGAALPVSVQVPGRAADAGHDPQVLFRTLSAGYIGTLGIPLRSGRNFTADDGTGGSAVLVNETFARTFWPGQEAVGRVVMLHKASQGYADYGEPLPGVVVGVIGDVHHFGPGTAPVPEIYVPYTRNPWSHMVLVARSRTDARALIPGLRRAILGVDPATILTGGTMNGFAVIDDLRDGGIAGERFNMLLLGSFALCAMLLSAIGIYGLMAYAVAQRTRELGIRLALGAGAGSVVRLVLGSGGRLIIAGVVLGLAGAVALTRLLASLLFGVGAIDAGTFAITTILLAGVALLACYLPARRASRVEPVGVLRGE